MSERYEKLQGYIPLILKKLEIQKRPESLSNEEKMLLNEILVLLGTDSSNDNESKWAVIFCPRFDHPFT